MIYVYRTFLNKKVDLIGKVIDSKGTKEDVVKIENETVKLKGNSGYLVMDSKFVGKKMRFYIYATGTKDKLKTLNIKPSL